MYAVSERYKEYINNSTVRLAHSKIIVDGVEYTAQLKKYPSISFQGEFIGSFPAMSCTFEIYNIGVDLVGKEIEVCRGLEIDGVTEWVPLGKFTAAADGVKSSNTGDSVSYTGYDRAARFDVEYTAIDIEYPTTIGAFAQEIAFRRGVGFDTTPFPCCDIILDGPPNIPVGTSEREIIRQIAELGGANAWISRAGDLCISQPRQTAEKIYKRKYASLSSKEQKYGGINTVVLGKADYEDDIVYQNAEAVAADGIIEWRLESNMFAEVDREGFAEYIGDSYIIGLSYIPFEVSSFVDDWYFDPFDIVEIEDKNGEYFNTVILSYTTADRIKSNIAAGTPGEMLTNYEIAGTTQKKLSYVALQVDHVNNQISSMAVDISGMQSSIKQNAEQIELKVSYGDVISSINQTAETIQIDASKINLNGYVTVSDLGAEGETVIHGGRIDTDTLYVRHLSGADGDFTGNLTGDTCYFNNLVARSGGAIEIGNWEFLSNGLEYNGGVFDLEYVNGVACLSGTVPMQVGPYSNGVSNTLTLYGTKITFGVSTSNYTAVMTTQSGYEEICFRPGTNNTGNIGTATYVWDSGHFRNLHVHGSLSLSNLTVATLNTSGNARINDRLVVGSATASQPTSGIYVSGMVESTSFIKAGNMSEGDSSDYPVRWGSSTKRLVTYSSSQRYKTNIESVTNELADKVLDLRPVTYSRISSGIMEVGLIAEEVDKVEPMLCTYSTDEEGNRRPEGVNYENLAALNTRKIQDICAELAEIKAEIERMKTA